MEQSKKPIYKRGWFIITAVIVFLIIIWPADDPPLTQTKAEFFQEGRIPIEFNVEGFKFQQ